MKQKEEVETKRKGEEERNYSSSKPSSSSTTVSGMTTSQCGKEWRQPGSATRTEVSKTMRVRTPTGFSALPVVSPEGEPTSAVMCSATRSINSSWHFVNTESWIALLYFFCSHWRCKQSKSTFFRNFFIFFSECNASHFHWLSWRRYTVKQCIDFRVTPRRLWRSPQWFDNK